MQQPIVPASSYKSDSIHTDIYFEVGRKGLTDDAKAILATQADVAKNDPDLGILVQGYTDQQGSASYNKKLGLMRAEKVKDYLIGLGVSEQAIKVVSLGKDGVLCLDNSDVCRNMNRRVHLEMRKIGQEHMILPTVATEPKTTEPIQSANDQNGNTDGSRFTCRKSASFPCRSLGNRSVSTDDRSGLRQLTGTESDPGGAIPLLQECGLALRRYLANRSVGCAESSRLRKNHFGTLERLWSAHVRQEENTPAGCSKRRRLTAKAAASEGPRRTLWGTLRILMKRERRWRAFSASC